MSWNYLNKIGCWLWWPPKVQINLLLNFVLFIRLTLRAFITGKKNIVNLNLLWTPVENWSASPSMVSPV
ncbi:MAG: hypothetical protein JST42_18415 [Bacteroidetes bacterium]|nr:hypothetical protein [Bacteroidota bacterium]